MRPRQKKWFQCAVGVAALMSIMSNAVAYEPPIGIPDPGGADPKTGVSYGWEGVHPIDAVAPNRPNSWESGDVSGFYYVNPDHPESTDNNNDNGHPGKPRMTLPPVVPAGSYIEMAGNYDTNDMQVRYRCTVNSPCWIRGATGSAVPNITGDIDIIDASYLFVEGLVFDGGVGGAISISGDSHNVALRRNRVTNRLHPVSGASTGISARPGQGDIMENLVFFDNYFEVLGDLNVADDQDFHAMGLSMWGRDNNSGSELRNVWALDNFCTAVSGDCLQVTGFPNAESYPRLHHLYIGDNTSFNNRQGGFGVKQASDVIVSENLSHSYEGDGSGNAGGCFGYQYEKSNLWFLFNECHDSVFGIRQSDTGNGTVGEGVYMIGNLIYNIRPAADNTSYVPSHIWGQGVGIALWHGNLNRYVVDNTIFGTKAGVHANFRGGDVNVSGNIIADIGSDEGNTFFRLGLVSRPDNPREYINLDHNLFYDDTRQQYYSEQSGTGNMRSIEQVKLDSTYCQESCEFADPLFVNPSLNPETRDFRLQAGSPAIGANIKHPAYDRFEELYGLNIYKDFNGNDRHPTNPSLGAFEYVDETDPFDPAKLKVKIKYPTKNSVYTPSSGVTAIQFGGHASYEDETITVDWVLAQCETDCVEELADGVGESQVTGSTQTAQVEDYPQNNWHVNSQALFPGRNILIINAVHPNGHKTVTSLIIESEVVPEPTDEQAPVIEVLSPAATAGVITRSDRSAVTLSGDVSDNMGLNNMTWSCISGCTGGGTVDISAGATELPWQFVLEGLQYGLNRIVLMADDATGNTTSLTVSIQVNDTTAPQMSINRVSFSGTVSDDVAVQSVTWSCVSGCAGGGDATVSGNDWQVNQVPISNNSNTIRVEALDAAGNRSIEELVITR
ncbi:MAG: hypothetical protein ACRBHB_17000 [Arenicella sp.]